ncbi:MAG: hypothetical protein FRX49_01103 [Trebouxia sp. A1-2]|nr:MAG: hypothetical protein FRX49_13804 [Trebouxia sp. A1-2]KAA6428993.1 MAG: hypothetical protein FRX49_01103 [Trebouxia sp. A1-2]
MSVRLVVLLALLAVPFAMFVRILSGNVSNDSGTRYDAVDISLSDEKGAVDRLVNFLKFRTTSNSGMQESHAQDPEQFRLAHKHLQQSYPSVWKQLNVEVVC